MNAPEPDEDTPFVGVARVPPRWVDDEPQPTPRIEPDELAGLRSAEASPVGVPVLSPLVDRPSRLVASYLFPTERYRGEWRRHLVHLAQPLAAGAAATALILLVAALAQPLQAYLRVGDGHVAILAAASGLLWVGTAGWVAWQVALWQYDRFILTNKRVLVVSGIVSRDVAMMPLQRVTDMKYQQSALGRVFNYGTFVLESAGQDQALREIAHLPSPNELYLRVVEEMYEPGAVEARVEPVEGGTAPVGSPEDGD